MATRRQFSDKDKAAALAVLDANNGNVFKTAKQLNIGRTTLEGWSKGRGINHDVPELRQHKKDEISQRLVEIVHKLIDAMPDKITDANLQQVSTSIGIAVEKIQLLDGDPTERNEIVDHGLNDSDRASRIAALLERARTRRDRPSADDGFIQ